MPVPLGIYLPTKIYTHLPGVDPRGQKWGMNVIAYRQSVQPARRSARIGIRLATRHLLFRDPYYTELLAIWREKAGDRKMPCAVPDDARAISRIICAISFWCSVRSKDPSHYRWRLIGTSVTEIVGHHTGKLFEDSIPPDANVALERSVAIMILESEQPWRFLGRVQTQGPRISARQNISICPWRTTMAFPVS